MSRPDWAQFQAQLSPSAGDTLDGRRPGNVPGTSPVGDTAHLPTQAAVHAHVRTLLDARGYVTRGERVDFMAAVLGRELRWPYEITLAEADQVLAALADALDEPTGEISGEMP